MRASLTVADPRMGARLDVVLEAEPDTPLLDVVRALEAALRGVPASTGDVISMTRRRALTQDRTEAWVLGSRLDPSAPLAGSPIREGAIVSLGDPSGSVPAEPAGVVDLRVAGGPGAGAVHRLSVGEWALGADHHGDHTCAIAVEDPALSPVAVVVLIAPDGGCTLVPQAGSAPHLEAEPVTGETVWAPGKRLRVGAVLLEIAPPTPADAALHPSEDGAWLDYNRPPRLLPPPRRSRFRLPGEPPAPGRRAFPILMMIAPLVLCVGAALIFHAWYYLMLGLLSPVTMAGNHVYERRTGRRTHRADLADFRARTAEIEAQARVALELEDRARRAEAPDPGTVLLIATGPRARLWERRRADPDHLLVRVGTAELPSQVELERAGPVPDHERVTRWTLRDAPVALALDEAGVLGVAGTRPLRRRLCGWLLCQLAVLQSPRDVRFVVLTDVEGLADWEWLRWLPHARSGEEAELTTLIGADDETLSRRIAELSAVLAARQDAVRNMQRAIAGFRDPDLIVVLDGARRLRALPGVVALLAEGPAVGIRAICLDADERLLPAECTSVVSEGSDGLQVRRHRADVVLNVRPDLVSLAWCERVARSLAPLRDVAESADGANLPASVRLLDVLGLEPPDAQAIVDGWKRSGRTTEVAIGQGLDGQLRLDLRRDGPHALIAGTTGAGKSELLQTLVAALAVANRPDEMTFVLVDYKGGSAFKDCERLPHTVGLVTDLDEHLVRRALESLSAELRRREQVLAAAGAKDLEDYTDLADRDGGHERLPRLVIVIDEFGSLVRELPDFVSGLVGLAQRGRSLGIHLVLATQRPSGVVSPEIRANTNLRIALRVTDAAESSDVVDAPDAARISRGTPGRAYARLGHASLVPFQAGRVGGRRPGRSLANAGSPWVREFSWTALGHPAAAPARTAQESAVEDTDLGALVDSVREAARRLGVPVRNSPWLPALPARVLLAELAGAPPGAASAAVPAVPFALEDLPAAQQQRAVTLDLATFGHLFVIGGPRTGRSQALRTIAGSIASHVSSRDVHLFGIDCGNGALLPMTGLPHCGAVVLRSQTERAQRLIARLSAEVTRRQEVLAAGGFADVPEQRRSVQESARLPHLIVLLDRWEGFLGSLGDLDGGSLIDSVIALLREGASAGVHLVLTGDRQLLSGRLSVLTDDKLVLRLPDRSDFSLAGIAPRSLPDSIPDGRAFRTDSAVEVQLALLDADPSGAAQGAALERIGELARAREGTVPAGMRPLRIDVLPTRIGFEQAWELRAGPLVGRPLWGMVGVGGDELVARGADLAGGTPTFVVAGPAKSGRSTVLVTMARSFLRGGGELVAIAPRPSPLRDLAGSAGVRAVLCADDVSEHELAPLLAPGGPVVLVVDDAELVKDCSARDYLRDLVRTAADQEIGVVIGGHLEGICVGFTGWQIELRKNRHGVLLSPQQVTDGDLIGVRLSRSLVGGPAQPGRALLQAGSGDLVTVQVPFG